jgi:hypothetical protein
VSHAAEGIDPLSTPCFNCCSVREIVGGLVAALRLALPQNARAKLEVGERLRGLQRQALLLLSTWPRGNVKESCLFARRGLVDSADRHVGGWGGMLGPTSFVDCSKFGPNFEH